ncbi:hypothetical protein C7Y66_27290 [Chroococcidiopsis sp. CCALA 051]|uniref:beta strand repeat-containing protein n=1 Tax=Chroococcidiopsis sp. CCALA 051 TaxID=869949 RepID=UPI000D0D9D38|nr:S-layer family protein [Chroococcidiopsis sp. CCALA 051]MBE9019681.1 S-layer family protein [Chroococcidiopsidales cyanobacterium LEGE 13417]PSM46020.1 hypothetical protein C7Y66_27290 [Chroococcidiopsis sp. CCALA 051]
MVEIIGIPNAYGSSTFLTADVNSGAKGQGGNLTITTKKLSVKDGGLVSTNTFGEGNAGNLTINVENLSINNSQISASTFDRGNAGSLTVNASQSIEISGELPGQNERTGFPGGLLAQVNPEGKGNGGNLTIQTKRLSVSDGSKVQVSTFGIGNSGDLLIRASDIDVFESSINNFYSTGIFAETSLARSSNSSEIIGTGQGNAGNLTIETERLRIRNGGQVSAATFGLGNAGNLTVRASDLIEVSGIEDANAFRGSRSVSLLTADVKQGATGRGGNIKIETGRLKIDNEAQISVSAFDESGTAGNLEINADSINLDRGTITAATAFGEGGNINLKIDDTLFMRNNSSITAQALNNANGGNININAPNGFIIAFPKQNNDIVANAAQGRGGNINITAESIFGILERPLNSITNDINASSEFGLQGNISINNPDVDPSRGLIELPENVVDPSTQIAQNPCQRGVGSEFTVTGRGGLPPSPDRTLNSDNVRVGLVAPVPSKANTATTNINLPSVNSHTQEIVPAQGWVFNNKGEVMLTTYDPTNKGVERSRQNPATCAAR